MDKTLIESARKKIKFASNIVVVSHIRPDGDAIGSLLGIGLALETIGKGVQFILADGIPESLRFLPGSAKIVKEISKPFDLVIVVDCSELSRTGNVLPADLTPDINIDHHITNTNFAVINLVDPEAAATAEILSIYSQDLGLAWNPDMRDALLSGIMTDTIGFTTTSTRAETLRQAANLVERGANLPELYRQALSQRSFNALRYWGLGLSVIKKENRLVWTELTLKDRQQAEYPGRDDADLINILSSLREIDIALIFIEQSCDSVKISWRSQNGYDVSKIAVHFGGGGHRAAAGAEMKGTLEEIKTQVLEETRSLLNQEVLI